MSELGCTCVWTRLYICVTIELLYSECVLRCVNETVGYSILLSSLNPLNIQGVGESAVSHDFIGESNTSLSKVNYELQLWFET